MSAISPASHLNRLLLRWYNEEEKPTAATAIELNISLWRTILAEVLRNTACQVQWDTLTDPRVRWANQYILNCGDRSRIDPDLTANVEFILSPFLNQPPPPASHKSLAANDQ